MFESAAADFTIDELEQHLADCTGLIGRMTAKMLPAIRALDAAQIDMVDGARGMDEWLSARLDVDVRTARTLLGLARSNDERVDEMLEEGASVDRANATLRLIQSGADQATVDESVGRDIAGVRQMTAQRRPISPDAESDSHAGRFLHMQPSLDESIWRLWGQLSGVDGRIVEKAISTSVDSLPNDPDATAGQLRADGLVSVASEWLSGEIGGHELTAEIFIDAALATTSEGREGVSVVSGPRVGPNTLGEILCSGTVRVTVHDDVLRAVSTSPASRAIPPAIRSFVLHRDGRRCVIGGCQSRSRLQPHHLVSYSEGGSHHPDNLVTLCWFHHHVVVHQRGMVIDPALPPHSRTFLRAIPTRAGP